MADSLVVRGFAVPAGRLTPRPAPVEARFSRWQMARHPLANGSAPVITSVTTGAEYGIRTATGAAGRCVPLAPLLPAVRLAG